MEIKLFDKIIRYVFSKRIKSHQLEEQRERRFVKYENARSVLLLFESDEMEKNPGIRKIIQNLTSDGKKVSAWGYVNKKQINTAILPDYKILNKKDTDFFQRPNESFIRELENSTYDLLIDITENEIIPLQYIALYANVGLKTGVKRNNSEIYDFLIDMESTSNQTEESFVEVNAGFIYNQIIFYIKSIQTSD